MSSDKLETLVICCLVGDENTTHVIYIYRDYLISYEIRIPEPEPMVGFHGSCHLSRLNVAVAHMIQAERHVAFPSWTGPTFQRFTTVDGSDTTSTWDV